VSERDKRRGEVGEEVERKEDEADELLLVF